MAKGGKLGLRNTSKRINKVAATQQKQEATSKPSAKNVKLEKMLDAMHDEPIKKLTVRIPVSLHRTAKAKVALDDTSLNEYIINLLKDDLINETRLPEM